MLLEQYAMHNDWYWFVVIKVIFVANWLLSENIYTLQCQVSKTNRFALVYSVNDWTQFITKTFKKKLKFKEKQTTIFEKNKKI